MYIAFFAASLLTTAPDSGAASSSSSALERFFMGTTESSGTVDTIMSGRHTVRNRSEGRMDASGALLLDQVVEEQGKPARRSTWRLVHAGGNRITGTTNDVRGPVTGEITDNSLHLRYQMKNGTSVKQWITLQSDGRSARNRMTYHRFGIKVATVVTEIRKVE